MIEVKDAVVASVSTGIALVALSSAGIAILLWEGIPWLWTVVKPWLHQVTG